MTDALPRYEILSVKGQHIVRDRQAANKARELVSPWFADEGAAAIVRARLNCEHERSRREA